MELKLDRCDEYIRYVKVNFYKLMSTATISVSTDEWIYRMSTVGKKACM